MNRLFDIDQLTPAKSQDPEEKSEILRDNFLHLHEHKVRSLKELNGRFPAPGELFALWTLKSFNAFTFIPYLISEFGKINFLAFSTYTINRRIIDSLIHKIDQGKIDQVRLFISDSLKFRMPRAVDHLQAMIVARPGKIASQYSWNHSKITLMQAGGNYFVVEGSGNFGENAQFEQYIFINDRRLYEFRLNCITHDLHQGTAGNG